MKIPASGGRTTGYSPVASVTVYTWRYLSNMETVDYEYGFSYGAYYINGNSYVRSIGMGTTWGDTRWGEWNLGRKCTHFNATIGIADDSSSTASATFITQADSVLKDQRSLGLGQSATITVPIAGYLRIHLEVRPNNSSSGTAVWGNARIRCSF